MNIVIDENIPLAVEFFSTLGEVTLVAPRDLSPQTISDADALIVRSVVKIDQALLQNSRVKFVGTCTAGFDHLATDYMEQQGIHWCSAAGCNANAVVQYVFSVLATLFFEKNLDWKNKVVGIIGCGNVGSRLYQQLRSLDIKCRVYDPFLSVDQIADLTTLDEVLSSDIVCLHAPLTHHVEHPSFHLLNESNLNQLKDDVVLISAGRGAVVNNADLLNWLTEKNKTKNNITVALDVWEDEPYISQELMNAVDFATPHIAGHSYDGKALGTEMIYQALCQFLSKNSSLTFNDFDNTEKQSIAISEGDSAANDKILNSAILQAYDVREDDKQFRLAMNEFNNKNSEEIKNTFDRLRKHYPIRREFSHNTIKNDSLKKDSLKNDLLRQQLQSLGFEPVK